jgi:phosphohistidine phosphatase
VKIWIVRHAKSSWADPGKTDFDRPLNARGKRDGPRMQIWLAAQTHPAQWLVTSCAARALATSVFVAAGFDLAAEVVIEDSRLYLASAETAVDVLRETPADVESVALVAHNPGISHLLDRLIGEHRSGDLPTFGTARLGFDGAWPDLQFGACDLELVTSPKRL